MSSMRLVVLLVILGLVGVSYGQNEAQLSPFRTQCLARHNYFRAKHQAPPLVLNQAISDISQKWACYLLNSKRFEHSTNSNYGENLYMSWSSSATYLVNGAAAVDSWYNEIKDYNFTQPGFSSATGHFTQVVWKGSVQLGCGWCASNGYNYVVSNYSPPGNYANQFAANVLPAV